jgi:hypothetical protein
VERSCLAAEGDVETASYIQNHVLAGLRRRRDPVRTPRRRLALATVASLAVLAGIVLGFALVRAQDSRGDYDAHVDAYRRVGDDMHIVVFVTIGFGDPLLGYEAREDAEWVSVTVHARNRVFGSAVAKNLAAYTGIPVTVTLQDPLRQRKVVDASGGAVPEITCPDRTFSCFVGR